MEKISINDDLPVAIMILNGGTEIKCGSFIMSSMTAVEYVKAQANTKAGQYVSILDVVAMTKVVDDAGTEYELDYDHIADGPHFNLIRLNEAKAELEAKVKAAA
ncbi:hypothetical protein [Acinetobacter gerneri]|uniref:Phage protein n=1 Tax=Acinetobacter gerneri DSM 14967 = CIP 107464 = MTCC 9824 TaxID=1120926 RepID=N8YAV9_9GAMM|nr:hypothetical protein [Acinetobacter gerneri]ENV33917.1 hypothetical protein F960_01923 [Acinetobacter gerneri DSM 14967 = CIP 107464 = MTCC 9824]EPR82794.1 hypothetical protein L289_2712 [Acinetobacter gerneri DSM 14967 = CIP 107464 = MTCC 9824]